jgi:hypothetical protein
MTDNPKSCVKLNFLTLSGMEYVRLKRPEYSRLFLSLLLQYILNGQDFNFQEKLNRIQDVLTTPWNWVYLSKLEGF